MTKNRLLGITYIFILLIAFTALFSWLLYPRNNYTEDATDALSGNTLLGEVPGTVDVLIVGDSQAYESYNPMEMWGRRGITSYVSSTSAQPICETVDFVKAGFKNQHPKVVLVEADTLYVDCSIGKYAFTRLKDYVPLLQYHSRWKLIGTKAGSLKKDFTNTDELKGYNLDPTVDPIWWDASPYMSVNDVPYEISAAARLSMKDISRICAQNNAKLIIVSIPNLSWSNSRHDAVQALAGEIGADYIDLNIPCEMEPIDWFSECKDQGVHVNYFGAKKISSYLADYLADNYGIEDRRENPEYSQYALCYSKYLDLVRDFDK